MRVVIINHLHPETRHVSGMRAWYFAKALADLGHQVLLLCGPNPSRTAPALREEPPEWRIAAQDWAGPLVLALSPLHDPLLAAARAAPTPGLIRRALLGTSYVFRSGVFTDFLKGVRGVIPIVASKFRPAIVWAIFGNTDCWQAARELSAAASAPWVGDVKDNWEVFIRPALRKVLARRFRTMGAATANADFHGSIFARWSGRVPVTVYSGVADCFFAGLPAASDRGPFRITLTGSIRSEEILRDFAAGVAAFAENLVGRGRAGVELTYAGADIEKARKALEGLPASVNVVPRPYIGLDALAGLCRSADVNAYVRNEGTFHHKLLELLACGKPVLPFPREGCEGRRLAEVTHGVLLEASNPGEIVDTLERAAARPFVGPPSALNMEAFRWKAQALILERVLLGAASARVSR